jgi:hypothetical protein
MTDLLRMKSIGSIVPSIILSFIVFSSSQAACLRIDHCEQRVGLEGSEYGLLQRFLPNLIAWEAEEVACIREYIFDYYTEGLAKLRSRARLVMSVLRGCERFFTFSPFFSH